MGLQEREHMEMPVLRKVGVLLRLWGDLHRQYGWIMTPAVALDYANANMDSVA